MPTKRKPKKALKRKNEVSKIKGYGVYELVELEVEEWHNKEIKAALKMCADNCFRISCPYGAAINCCGKLKRDALNLITEQENEIEKLKAEVNKGCDNCETVKQAKIDVLTELKTRAFQSYQVGMYIVNTEQIDQMIEELKK